VTERNTPDGQDFTLSGSADTYRKTVTVIHVREKPCEDNRNASGLPRGSGLELDHQFGGHPSAVLHVDALRLRLTRGPRCCPPIACALRSLRVGRRAPPRPTALPICARSISGDSRRLRCRTIAEFQAPVKSTRSPLPRPPRAIPVRPYREIRASRPRLDLLSLPLAIR
jgi:hypothetical protein